MPNNWWTSQDFVRYVLDHLFSLVAAAIAGYNAHQVYKVRKCQDEQEAQLQKADADRAAHRIHTEHSSGR